MQLCQEVLHRQRAFVAAVSTQQEKGDLRTAMRQVQEKLKTGLITPVDIFYHEQGGVVLRLPGEKVQEDSKQATFLLFWIERGQHRNGGQLRQQQGQVRQEASEFWCRRFQISGRRCCVRVEVGAQQVEQRGIWEG